MKAAIIVAALGIFCYGFYSFVLVNWMNPEKLTAPANGYYGIGKERSDNPAVLPFKVNVAETAIEDLKSRLKASRIGHEQLEDVNDFEYGFNLATLNNFKEHWLNKFDWKKQEKLINSFAQFTTELEGLKIHFIHVNPPQGYKKVVPLLLVHGWPGNVFEFHKVIPMLTDPKKYFKQGDVDLAFEVVVPSIPGYGWSEQPHKKDFNHIATARIFHKLMKRLKTGKYIAQGGDWGSMVVSNIGRMFPEEIIGIHVNVAFPVLSSGLFWLYSIAGSYAPSFVFSSPHFSKYSLKKMFMDGIRESGYLHLQATKPDTIGVGLNDSPIGLMVYILEKFSTGTNPLFLSMADGGLEKKYTKDELLTIVSIYWFNQNILSSQRYYKEAFDDPSSAAFSSNFVSVPTGYAMFPHDVGGGTPIEILRQAYNVSHYTSFKDGGHFAAFEMPTQLAGDIFQFSKKVV